MPYSGASDTKLPNHVKKMPAKQRRQWVHVFNGTMEGCQKKGGKDCESAAFRSANGVVKEYLVNLFGVKDIEELDAIFDDWFDEETEKTEAKESSKELTEAEKCGMMAMSESVYYPSDVQSFADADEYLKTREQSETVKELSSTFNQLYNNIMYDQNMSLPDKVKAIQDLTDELSSRIGSDTGLGEEADDMGDMSGMDMEDKSVFTRVRNFLSGGKARTAADYADVGDPKKPSTWKLRIDDATHIAGAITALQPGGFRGNPVKLQNSRSSVISKISGAIGRVSASEDVKKNLRERLSKVKDDSTFKVFKDNLGNNRWLAIYTNNYYDREKEVFPRIRHKEFVEYVDKTKDYPELWLWHTPGSRWGIADFLGLTDEGFVVASGTIDAGKEVLADKLAKSIEGGEDIRLSHGFRYDPDQYDIKERAYGPYWTFEISPLPGERAANEGTGFYLGRNGYMPLTEEKRKWLSGYIGEDQMKTLESQIDTMNKELQAKGISFKDMDFVEEKKKDDAPTSDPPASTEVPQTTENTPGAATPNLAEQIAAALMPKVNEAIDAKFAEFDKNVKDYQATTDQKIAQLSKSDDQKIEDRFRQPDASAIGDKASSNDDSNVVDKKDVDAIKKALGLTEDKSPVAPYANDVFRLLQQGGGGE